MKLFLSSAVIFAAAILPAFSNPFAVFNQTKTGKRFEYHTPNSGTPIYKGATQTDSFIIIRDLDTSGQIYAESYIELTVVGTKKYYDVDLAQTKKWNSLEIGGSENAKRGLIRYPTGNYILEYTLDGDIIGSPSENTYRRFTDYVFGVQGSVSVAGYGTRTFSPTVSGYGSYFEYQTTPTTTYPLSGNVVIARNYINTIKFNAKNTTLMNVGKTVELTGETLIPGTRGYGAYQICTALAKLGYLDRDL